MFLWLKMTRPTSTFSSEALVESPEPGAAVHSSCNQLVDGGMQRHGVVAMPGSFCSPEPGPEKRVAPCPPAPV